MGGHEISFPETDFQKVCLPEDCALCEGLDARNSPLLFGCRTGICGTCLIEVVDGYDNLEAPDEEEQEALSIYAPEHPKARLACQIKVCTDLKVKRLRKEEG